mmetsp:Transcript_13982/g.50882  ORF Transcript_13982/g.50882 Transcript_13982/m.50882 type:complete len:201 (+) Transcript_13982:2964-3566(+)
MQFPQPLDSSSLIFKHPCVAAARDGQTSLEHHIFVDLCSDLVVIFPRSRRCLPTLDLWRLHAARGPSQFLALLLLFICTVFSLGRIKGVIFVLSSVQFIPIGTAVIPSPVCASVLSSSVAPLGTIIHRFSVHVNILVPLCLLLSHIHLTVICTLLACSRRQVSACRQGALRSPSCRIEGFAGFRFGVPRMVQGGMRQLPG